MSSGWRLARSLDVLRAEIWQVAPGTTVWTIGDARHRATASDHNPNRAGVVCALDLTHDPASGVAWMYTDLAKVVLVGYTQGYRDVGAAGQILRYSVVYEAA